MIKVGGYITFGAYEQDNNTDNGKEEIEWLVLDVQDGKALVISKYALEVQQYNTDHMDVTWETCSLRQWLNNDFINSAFSDDEKTMIPTVMVLVDKNSTYNTNQGNTTEDKIFLLSVTEAKKYFDSNYTRQCEPTDYLVAKWYGSSDYCSWWLRSLGCYYNIVGYVDNDGEVDECGTSVGGHEAVRPALWIDLK